MDHIVEGIKAHFRHEAYNAGFDQVQTEFLCRWFEDRILALAEKAQEWGSK